MLSSDVSMGTMTVVNPGSKFREHEFSLHASMVDKNSVSVDDVDVVVCWAVTKLTRAPLAITLLFGTNFLSAMSWIQPEFAMVVTLYLSVEVLLVSSSTKVISTVVSR